MQTSGYVCEAFKRLTEREEDPPYIRWLHFMDWGLSYSERMKRTQSIKYMKLSPRVSWEDNQGHFHQSVHLLDIQSVNGELMT